MLMLVPVITMRPGVHWVHELWGCLMCAALVVLGYRWVLICERQRQTIERQYKVINAQSCILAQQSHEHDPAR